MWSRLGTYTYAEFHLHATLSSGQTHYWKSNGEGVWSAVLGSRLFLVRQTPQGSAGKNRAPSSVVEYRVVGSSRDSSRRTRANTESSSVFDTWEPQDALHYYFRTDQSLQERTKQWSSPSTTLNILFRSHSQHSQVCGVRLMQQDPWCCLLSYICSQNNNIARISGMVFKLCERYGTFVAEFEGIRRYSFPTPQDVRRHATEKSLRDLGFGYRAPYILYAAQWASINSFNHCDRSVASLDEARKRLMAIKGVGRKVADCVLLFSLHHDDVVPVDTHIQQIAERYLGISGALTSAQHERVRQQFLEAFGEQCGWAHCVLFYSKLLDLGNNKKPLVADRKRVREG